MGFMYLICLGEWAMVETKALRHILQAGTLFKYTNTHVARNNTQPCIHTYTCKFMHLYIFKSFVDIVFGITGSSPHSIFSNPVSPQSVFRNEVENALFSYCDTSYIFDTMQWLWSGFYESWRQNRGNSVDAQSEFVYLFPPSTWRSEVIISYRALPEDMLELQWFDQGHFRGEGCLFQNDIS